MCYLIMVFMGFLLIGIGATGYLKSVIVEKHTTYKEIVFVDGENNKQFSTIESVLDDGYKIVKKEEVNDK